MSNLFSLDKKVVLITGATGILGRHLVRGLYDAGAKVVITDLKLDDCEKLRKKISPTSQRLLAADLDITSPVSIQRCLKLVLKKFGRLDGLVNNAFLRPLDEKFLERKIENFRKATEVNIHGTLLVTQAAAKIMRKQQSGNIVNIGSIYGLVSNDQSLYDRENNVDYNSLHKGAILNFTRYLAALLAKHGIRVNAITPGGILWVQPNGGPAANRDFQKRYSARAPLGRMADPNDMNGALIYLLSNASSYVAGHNLVVDGGWTAI